MRRIMASLTMVSETSGSSSYSLARRRQRPSQPSVLSATQRRGRRTKPVGAREPAHDDQGQAEQEAGEQGREPVVDAVGEHDPEPG